MAEEHGVPPRILRAVDEVNEQQKQVMIDKIDEHFGGKLAAARPSPFGAWPSSRGPMTFARLLPWC